LTKTVTNTSSNRARRTATSTVIQSSRTAASS